MVFLLLYLLADNYGKIGGEQHVFERILRFDFGRLQNITISTLSVETSPGCFQECALNSECKSCLFTEGYCHILNWYLEFSNNDPIDVQSIYFGKTLNSNIAALKATNASSVFSGDWNRTQEPVDGKVLSSSGQCSGIMRTQTGDLNPWWRVDLADVYMIVQIVWISKQDPEKLYRQTDIEIVVGNTLDTINQRCGYFVGPAKIGMWNTENCPPATTGQFVQFQKPVLKDPVEMILELCEVEVRVIL